MTGLLAGVVFGLGCLLVWAGWSAGRPVPPLVAALQRVPAFAPSTGAPAPRVLAALTPALHRLARLFGGRAALERRLRLAGDAADVESHLLTQVLWAGAAAALTLLLLGAAGALDRGGPALALTALAIAGGLLLGDFLLSRRIARRREAVAEQFPIAAQLFALLVSAGVPPSDAVGRVGRALGGPLGQELTVAAQRTASGQGFASAMREFADVSGQPVIERFVYGLLSAIERGSPLSEIMRAQALDAAADSHRGLMTAAGKRDIAMLVPVVFAVLPTVVMVALLPGAVQLGLVGG